MKRMNITEIKNHFHKCVREVETGKDIGVCRRNVLVAHLTATKYRQHSSNKTRLGCGRHTVIFSLDLTEPMITLTD